MIAWVYQKLRMFQKAQYTHTHTHTPTELIRYCVLVAYFFLSVCNLWSVQILPSVVGFFPAGDSSSEPMRIFECSAVAESGRRARNAASQNLSK